MINRFTLMAGVAAAFVALAWSPLAAQDRPAPQPAPPGLPLAPTQPHGDIVAPYFDGWYENPDGSYTYSFGFMNRNRSELIEIPLGENNFIEPAELDGMQPTHFPVVSYGGFSGPRERGAFAVTVPPGFTGDVVWTLTHQGRTYSVPGRATAGAYELGYEPMAAGSLMPLLRYAPDGPEVQGRVGTWADPITASVGEAVELELWGEDQGVREGTVPLNATWYKHQGPVGAEVSFDPRSIRVETDSDGRAATLATFDQPGEYVVRVRLDNFPASDSSFADQCCWTNGYFPVTVTP